MFGRIENPFDLYDALQEVMSSYANKKSDFLKNVSDDNNFAYDVSWHGANMIEAAAKYRVAASMIAALTMTPEIDAYITACTFDHRQRKSPAPPAMVNWMMDMYGVCFSRRSGNIHSRSTDFVRNMSDDAAENLYRELMNGFGIEIAAAYTAGKLAQKKERQVAADEKRKADELEKLRTEARIAEEKKARRAERRADRKRNEEYAKALTTAPDWNEAIQEMTDGKVQGQ